MKRACVFLVAFVLLGVLEAPAQAPSSFNRDWKFHLGDDKKYLGADFDDAGWRTLALPHDWSIEGTYAQRPGSNRHTGYLPNGVGWYRKIFEYPPPNDGGRLFIQFDGIYMNSEVWINEFYLGRCPYGYTSFIHDLTPFLAEDGKNTIAVRVDTPDESGRWYTGSGITRNVWLIETPGIYLEHWEPFFTTPEVTATAATWQVEAKIVDRRPAVEGEGAFVFRAVLLDRKGEVVSQGESTFTSRSLEDTSLVLSGVVPEPALWSPEHPNLYTLRSSVWAGGVEIQHREMRVGIRSLVFDPDRGFLLNGIPTKFKGVNDHHTAGSVGAAVPEGVLHRRLKLLKEMGCNAIRTGHNPYAPEFYRLCDELGLMVMNEAFDGWNMYKAHDDYGRHFKGWWRFDLSQFLRRDRNHPSVVMWSIGNEVQMLSGRWPLSQKLLALPPHLDPTREIQQELVALCHELDPTRPVTQGWAPAEFSRYLDIVGLNGSGELEGEIELNRTREPNKPIVGTEVPHTAQTRGVYYTTTRIGREHERVFVQPDLAPEEVFAEDVPTFYFHEGREVPLEGSEGRGIYGSSYGNHYTRTPIRRMWQRTLEHDYFMGMFRWGSFDYLGEAEWPRRMSRGVLDICGFPTDAFFLYQSLWRDEPMVHVLPHWTHPGKEGVGIPVMVYTNGDAVELFLDDVSLGRKPYVGEDLVWAVPYQPGTIKAVATVGGKVVATAAQSTASAPAAIHAVADLEEMRANGSDVIHVEINVVDDQGVMVPKATNPLHFDLNGPIKILGVDNGDPVDLSPYQVNHRRAFRGKALIILQATREAGRASLTITGDGLRPQTLHFVVKP